MDSIYPSSYISKYALPCVNPLLLPTENDLIKKETPQYGIGIYTLHYYERGECIGQFLARPSHEISQHTLQRSPHDHMEDPYFVGYLLHSCDPNVVVDMHQQKVFCLKDIQAGEPLFMDYASTEDTLFKQFSCACDAPNCRHWITGRNETVNDEGKHFLGLKERAFTQQNNAFHETCMTG